MSPPSGNDPAASRRRVLIIVNPAAGRARRSRRRLDRVVGALRRQGCAVVVRWTGRDSGEAERLAREEWPEADVVVAAGGDGTLHAVANGIAAAARPVALALLPFGTANVLAREIGLPRDPVALARLIAAGEARPVWPGQVGGRLFLTAASSGFDAAVVAAVSPSLKRRFGRLGFAVAIVGGLLRYRPHRLTVECDGATYPAASVIATKARHYAGGWLVEPDASLADPTLDLVLFRRSGRLAVLQYLGALLRGRLPRRADVAVLRCRAARVSAAHRLPVQADGEIVGELPAVFAVADRPLQLVQP